MSGSDLTSERQKELVTSRFQLEKEKEVESEQVRQKAELDQTVALETIRQQLELAEVDLESQRMTLIRGEIGCQSGR